MATQDVKDYLFAQTGIVQSQWKRLSKHKGEDGAEIRIFEDRVSGQIVQTIQTKDGSLSLGEITVTSEKFNANTNSNSATVSTKEIKKALKLINRFLEEGEVPKTTSPGFTHIPACFSFSFYGNDDHDVESIAKEQNDNPSMSVAGFNVFFALKDDEEGMCEHLGELLQPFLPDYLTEIQEATFVIHQEVMSIYDEDRVLGLKDGTVPQVAYNDVVALLDSKGFTYDKSMCPLAFLI